MGGNKVFGIFVMFVIIVFSFRLIAPAFCGGILLDMEKKVKISGVLPSSRDVLRAPVDRPNMVVKPMAWIKRQRLKRNSKK